MPSPNISLNERQRELYRALLRAKVKELAPDLLHYLDTIEEESQMYKDLCR